MIEVGKKYRTRSGGTGRVTRIVEKWGRLCVVVVADDYYDYVTDIKGRYWGDDRRSPRDLVSVLED